MKTLLFQSFLSYIRDKRATITIFLSPIAFMLILGFIIAGLSGGTHRVSVRIALLLSKKYVPFEKFIVKDAKNSGFDLVIVNDMRTLKEKINLEQAQIGIYLGPSTMLFLYNQSLGQYNNYLKLAKKFIYHSIKTILSNSPSYISVKPVSVQKGTQVTVISFIVPGAMSIAVTTACVLSMALLLSTYRSNGSLKLLKITPLNGVSFIYSIAFHRFWSSLLSSFLTLLAAEWVFSSSYSPHWLAFFSIMSTSVILSLGMGAIFSTVFRDVWTTMNFSTVSLTIMMLFSNVFYPFSIMPPYMRIIAHALPITYLTAGLRYALGIRPMYSFEFTLINVFFILAGVFLLFVSGKLIFHLERR